MARKKKRRATKPVAEQPPPDGAPPAGRWCAIDLTASVTALVLIVLGYLTRNVLNPDGVSYLDLATAVQHGDWRQYVQGYWSPLLPLMTALLGEVTSRSGAQLIPLAHSLSVLAALGAVAVIWWWTRREASPVFGRAAIAVMLLCSYGPPRFEALTPDILLLGCMIWLTYELLARSGRRWLIVGVLLGAAFLIKTSAWPWLILAVPLRLWAAPDGPSRRRVLWSTAVCAVIMSLWIVPMSLEEGRLTLGSAGRLNFSWYFLGDLSKLPDTDPGRNAAYQEIPVPNGQTLTLATFDDAGRWTYQPWGDPTAWAGNVQTNTARTPALDLILGYWLRNTGITLKWQLPMILAVLVPTFLVQRRVRMWRELLHERRDALMVMVLGAAGVAQFIAIHPEPRLTAPLAGMLALGLSHWCCGKQPDRPMAPLLRFGLSWLGVLVAVAYALSWVTPNIGPNRELEDQVVRITQLRERLRAAEGSSPRIAVVGPAAELMSLAYQTGAHISAQILPRSNSTVSTLSREQHKELLDSVLRGRATQIWVASDSGVQMWPIPR
jgi:hypothetical protein